MVQEVSVFYFSITYEVQNVKTSYKLKLENSIGGYDFHSRIELSTRRVYMPITAIG